MTDFLGQMLRRSRHEAQERKRFYASLNEINPTSLAAIQASQSRAAVAAASSEAALRASMAAQAAADEAKARLTSSAAAASSSTRPVAASTPAKTVSPASSSAAQRVLSSAAASSSSSSSSAAAKSSASPSSSSSPSSVVPSSSSSAAGRPVMTITQTPSYAPSSASASSAAPSGSVAAASSGTESTGMSTGGVIGAVAAGLVGLVIIGALCGWLFRKHSARKNSVTNEKNWRQIGDDNDGYNRPASPYHDDIYGQDAAPVIGSRRALAMARANAHEDSRPPTMMERNVAGAGAWRQQPDYGAYPAPGEGRLSPEGYGLDPHSRPYMQQAGRVPIIAEQYQYQNAQPITPDTSRQLISPLHPLSANDPYSPSFVPGRPGVPQTDRQIAQHEDFADFPSAALDRDEMDQDWAPHTATTNGDWPIQQMPTPQLPSPSPSYGAGPQLPMLPPMSPDSFGADFAAAGQSSSQKQVYADVARAAGVMEPVTPTPAQAKYAEAAAASSSSSRGLPPLPVYSREAPSPFQHGRPLSALEEVETPLSTPMPSTAGVHAYGQNPFDDVPLPASRSQGSLAQPQAPSTPVSAARYPPPSTPLAPESVTSSPMRGIEERTGWHSAAPAHRLSHMTTADDDDVYGGI